MSGQTAISRAAPFAPHVFAGDARVRNVTQQHLALIIAPIGEKRERFSRLVSLLPSRLSPALPESRGVHLELDSLLGNYQLALVDFDIDRPCAMTEFVRGLRGRYPDIAIVVVASVCSEPLIDAAMYAGATSVLSEQYSDDQIGSLIALAMNGVGHRPVRSLHSPTHIDQSKPLLDPVSRYGLQQHCAKQDALAKLSDKQLEVLSLISDGLTNSHIAQRLHVKVGTVKTHVTQILRRLGVERRAEAILKAQRMQQVRDQQFAFARDGEGLLTLLLPHVTYARYQKGEVIFRKGDPAFHLYYLNRGVVQMVDINKSCGSGEIFGEIGLFVVNGHRTSTARCETDVELFVLSQDQVQEMLYVNPQFAIHVVATIASRIFADRSHKDWETANGQ